MLRLKRALFPVGNMTSLINLKKAKRGNNELLVSCFRYCLAYSHLSKVNLLNGNLQTNYSSLARNRVYDTSQQDQDIVSDNMEQRSSRLTKKLYICLIGTEHE